MRFCSSKTGSRRQSKKKTILKHCLKYFKRNFKRKISSAKIWENLVTNHCRSLDAAISIRFTMSRCKRQKYYARSRGAKQPRRSDFNALLRDWVANHKRTARKNINKTMLELAVPMRGRFEHDPGTNERVPHPSAGLPRPLPSFILPFSCPFPRSCEFIDQDMKSMLARTIKEKTITCGNTMWKHSGVLCKWSIWAFPYMADL